MSYLLPRLPQTSALRRFTQIQGDRSLSRLAAEASNTDPNLVYGATGGTRLNTNRLTELRQKLVEIAKHHGYPKKGSTTGLTGFDYKASIVLAESDFFQSGEAWRNDVWNFIALILLPDLVEWRFPNAGRERYFGGSRNVFQRLWRRGTFLDRGIEHPKRWELIEKLSEDAYSAILERPTLSANPVVARALAEVWVEMSSLVKSNDLQTITRAATKALRAYNTVICFDLLPQEELIMLIRSNFQREAQKLLNVTPNFSELNSSSTSQNTTSKSSFFRRLFS
ncbi:DUF6339 family protein [Synechococcus elongatus]|uniref:DUF6339 family protein n=1 Tax=Synechococcus elongatus TaxID=32046 RepID=UPI0030CDDAAF